MSRRKKGPSPKKKWERMYRTAGVRRDPEVESAARELGVPLPEPDEVWRNERYHCSVYYLNEPEFEKYPNDRTGLCELSIHNHKRTPIHDWRDFQRIKNDVMGVEREACELYPSELRLIDSANEYHLFVLPKGQAFPFGEMYRAVAGPERYAEHNLGKARQRGFEQGMTHPELEYEEET